MALMPVAEALRLVLIDAKPLPVEAVPLDRARGRVLAEDMAALRTQPPAAVSAMDGYAVRASDIATAPATLKVIGEVAAGHPFPKRIAAGQAARIFTGGVMPDGSDTVIIQELTSREGDNVTVQKPTTKGRNVRDKGIDFSQGDVLLRKGRRLTDRDLMLAAAMNYPNVSVYHQPKVAVLGTGDELVAPGGTPRSGEIVYSNGFALIALARSEGADTHDLGIAPMEKLLEPEVVAARAAAIRGARRRRPGSARTASGWPRRRPTGSAASTCCAPTPGSSPTSSWPT
jgi:molybdopterin molybdotransferase